MLYRDVHSSPPLSPACRVARRRAQHNQHDVDAMHHEIEKLQKSIHRKSKELACAEHAATKLTDGLAGRRKAVEGFDAEIVQLDEALAKSEAYALLMLPPYRSDRLRASAPSPFLPACQERSGRARPSHLLILILYRHSSV
jgi:hypothetical protein